MHRIVLWRWFARVSGYVSLPRARTSNVRLRRPQLQDRDGATPWPTTKRAIASSSLAASATARQRSTTPGSGTAGSGRRSPGLLQRRGAMRRWPTIHAGRASCSSAAANLKAAAGDTWEWDGAKWQLIDASGPTARDHHATAWDPVSGRVVLFGGDDGSGVTADTWAWDGRQWTRLANDGPPPRATHGLAFDAQRGRLLCRGSLHRRALRRHVGMARGGGAGSVRCSLRRSTITRWRSTAPDARSSRSAGRTTGSRSRTARCVSRMTCGRRRQPKAHLRGSTPGWFTTLVSSTSSYTADAVQATRPSVISGDGMERDGPQSPISQPLTDDC